MAAVGDVARLGLAALQASPARRRARGVGVYLLVFDLLDRDGADQRARRTRSAAPRWSSCWGPWQCSSRAQLVPSVTARDQAREWLDPAVGEVGVEGVVVKPVVRGYRFGPCACAATSPPASCRHDPEAPLLPEVRIIQAGTCRGGIAGPTVRPTPAHHFRRPRFPVGGGSWSAATSAEVRVRLPGVETVCVFGPGGVRLALGPRVGFVHVPAPALAVLPARTRSARESVVAADRSAGQ